MVGAQGSNSNETSAAAEQSGADATPSTINASVRSESISASNISDQAAKYDQLGFNPYVEAIAEFLTNEATQPPLTLSIEGEWGSGKSSFMRQLQEELEQIERRDGKPSTKKVWFNAWRHDKVEALWAAFALEFLRQISQPRSRKELLSTWLGHLKLLRLRLNWRENWQEIARVLSLGLFFSSLALMLPALFLIVGADGVDLLSNQIICRLSPAEKAQKAREQDQCLTFEPGSGDVSEIILSLILWAGGFGGTATGAVALLAKAGEIMGDPKNDLKQYLESPDYDSKVAFIEQFHEDFEKIVSAYGGEGNKVYVFIDDLDRCELTKAADLMQGLNLLISNDPNLIFILGMDREKVAAGIALKQKDVLPYLSSPAVVLNQAKRDNQTELKGLEYGYAYIEKFVQLPFQVPKASEDSFNAFLGTLSTKTVSANPSQKSQRSTVFEQLWSSVKEWWLPWQRSEPDRQSGKTSSPTNYLVTEKPLLSRRETIKVELTGDSERVQRIILEIAPALDYNPRRIKQFINLFRLKVFIASNTGLFDEVLNEQETNDDNEVEQKPKPLTLEQLGKFTAMCMRYPLLQIDLEDNHELLANLQQYALERSTSGLPLWVYEKEYNETTIYWGRNPKLLQLLCIGCQQHSQNADGNSLDSETINTNDYNLEKVDVKQLLQVSSRVERIDRVPLRSERGVDYRTLRELLREKKWEEADEETLQVMLKATQGENRGYLGLGTIERFPCQDLQTIDQLWGKASDGKFGFSVQKELYVKCGGTLNGQHHEEAWQKFCEENGWQEKGKHVNTKYDMTSPLAHLPAQVARSRSKTPFIGGPNKSEVLFSRIEMC